MMRNILATLSLIALSALCVEAAPRRVSEIVEISGFTDGPLKGKSVISYDVAGRPTSVSDLVNCEMFYYGDSTTVVETDAQLRNINYRRAIKMNGDNSLSIDHYGCYGLAACSNLAGASYQTIGLLKAGKPWYTIDLTADRLLEKGHEGIFTGKITMSGGNVTGYEYGNDRYYRTGPTLDDLWSKLSIKYTAETYNVADYTFDFMTYILKWYTEACTCPGPFDFYSVAQMPYISNYPSELTAGNGIRHVFSYDRSDPDCLRVTIDITEHGEPLYKYVVGVYFD